MRSMLVEHDDYEEDSFFFSEKEARQDLAWHKRHTNTREFIMYAIPKEILPDNYYDLDDEIPF